MDKSILKFNPRTFRPQFRKATTVRPAPGWSVTFRFEFEACSLGSCIISLCKYVVGNLIVYCVCIVHGWPFPGQKQRTGERLRTNLLSY
jgi:hypothetical protein